MYIFIIISFSSIKSYIFTFVIIEFLKFREGLDLLPLSNIKDWHELIFKNLSFCIQVILKDLTIMCDNIAGFAGYRKENIEIVETYLGEGKCQDIAKQLEKNEKTLLAFQEIYQQKFSNLLICAKSGTKKNSTRPNMSSTPHPQTSDFFKKTTTNQSNQPPPASLSI